MYSLYILITAPLLLAPLHLAASPFISPSHSPLFYQQHKLENLLKSTPRVTMLGSSIVYPKDNRLFHIPSSFFPLPSSPLPYFSYECIKNV